MDDLIKHNADKNYGSYFTTLGQIIRSLLSFESTASSLNPNDDADSPYIEDADGNIYLKSQAQRDGAFGDDDDVDEANYEYKFIIEEEVE
jgi:hypothetical protein